MIRPRNDGGSDIEIIREDGSLRVIPVYRGCERRAFRLILAYRRANLLTDGEAAQAMCEMNTITESRASRQSANVMDANGLATIGFPCPSRLAAFRRVVSRAIDDIVKRWLSRDEAEACCGK